MKQLKIHSRTKIVYTQVDDEDYDSLIKYKWWITPDGYIWTRDHSNGWKDVKNLLIHRVVMNAPKGITVDHKDRNPLNNQKSNLRFATYTQQNINTKMRSDNTSGHRGVYWEPRRNCWRVCINFNKKQIHVGQFKDKDEAIVAYNTKCKELYGEFADGPETTI
jgi:hypothetical protein